MLIFLSLKMNESETCDLMFLLIPLSIGESEGIQRNRNEYRSRLRGGTGR